MTGPEHYREAERYLGSAARAGALVRDQGKARKASWQRAQVHAILALTAATALASDAPDLRAWREVAGTKASG